MAEDNPQADSQPQSQSQSQSQPSETKQPSESDNNPKDSNDKETSQEPNIGISSYGNAAGSKIESALSPVGNPVGKGLATVVAPVGNIVGSVVDNGIMGAARAEGGMTGVGAGAMDTEGMKKGWAEEKEKRRLEEEIGGKEQTGENPLGL